MIFNYKSEKHKFVKDTVNICDYDTSYIGTAKVFDFTCDVKSLDYSESSFKIVKYYFSPILGKYKNPYYDKFVKNKYVYIDDIGYFIISNTTEVYDNLQEYKEITLYSAEYIFTTHYLDTFIINMGTAGSINEVSFYSTDPKKSLVNIIFKDFPMWTIAEIGTSISQLRRSFDVDRKSIFDFIKNDIYDSFEIITLFDIKKFKIYFINIEDYGEDIGFRITRENLANQISFNYNENDIVTSLYCTGGDNMEFRAINCGYNNIINLSMFSDFFQKYNINLTEYDEFRKNKNKEYLDKYIEVIKLQSEYFDFKYGTPTADQINEYTDSAHQQEKLSENKVLNSKYGEINMYVNFRKMYSLGMVGYNWIQNQIEIREDTIKTFQDIYNNSAEVGYDNFTAYMDAIAVKEALEELRGVDKYESCYLLMELGAERLSGEKYLPYTLENLSDEEKSQASWKCILYDKKIEDLESELIDISKSASFEAWLDKYHVLSENDKTVILSTYQSLIIEDELTDDSFVITDSMWKTDISGEKTEDYSSDCAAVEMMNAFYKRCNDELNIVSAPQVSFDCTLLNLFNTSIYQTLSNFFSLGNYFLTEINAYNEEKVRLQEIHFDFSNPENFSCVFSNQVKYNSKIDNQGQKFKKLFGNLTSFAKNKIAENTIS